VGKATMDCGMPNKSVVCWARAKLLLRRGQVWHVGLRRVRPVIMLRDRTARL